MPKKSRTPTPPRRVQAPKQRSTPRQPRDNRRLLLIGVAVLALALAAGIAAYFLLGGESGQATIRDAGCEIEKKPAQGRQHVEQVDDDFEYNTDPPTTGPHHPIPAPFDVYEEPVEQSRLIHSLEHGGVVIQYGDDVPAETVDAIVSWYRDDPNGIVIAPLPRLGETIALGAWVTEDVGVGEEAPPGEGVVAKCTEFDEAAFEAFKDEFGFRGPERFPREDLRPGA